MKRFLIGAALAMAAAGAHAEPVIYTSKALFMAALAAHDYSVVSESFEDDGVWAASRNSIVSPGSTPSLTSQGITWRSNYTANRIATGDVGGSAPAGTYAIYSLPHGMTSDSGLFCDSAEDPDIPIECFQNDGLKVASANGLLLYAFGGRVDSNGGSPKVTFLLGGVDVNANDTDNIDNWQREGDFVNNWSFIGVIDTDGFNTAEMRELRGKDAQQVLIFSDDYVLGVGAPLVTCSMGTTQTTYSGTDTLTVSSFAIANASAGPASVEWKVWLDVPSVGPVGLINFGANGSFVLPVGFSVDYAPIDLSVASNVPTGTYVLGCRLLDPVTGAVINEDLRHFEVIP